MFGTYESDPEYQAFVARESAPPQPKKAEINPPDSKQASQTVNDPKQTALLKYLREKSEKKILLKKTNTGKKGAAGSEKKSSSKASKKDKNPGAVKLLVKVSKFMRLQYSFLFSLVLLVIVIIHILLDKPRIRECDLLFLREASEKEERKEPIRSIRCNFFRHRSRRSKGW